MTDRFRRCYAKNINISKVFNHVIDTRLAMTASMRTDDSIAGSVFRAKVKLSFPDSKVDILWLRVAVFGSGNIVSSDSINTKPQLVEADGTDDSDVTEKLNDVFSDFIDLIAEHVHAVK